MPDYTQIDPLEFMRATQRHADQQQAAANPAPQDLPPVGANGGGQPRMSGGVGSYFGPASQALMAALTGANPQSNIAAMTANPAAAAAVSGAPGAYTPRQTVTTPRIQWGAPGSDPNSVTFTGGQPIAPPAAPLPLNGTTPTPPGTVSLMGSYTPQSGVASPSRVQFDAAGSNPSSTTALPALLQSLFN